MKKYALTICLTAVALGLATARSNLRSDAALQSLFLNHRADFESLVAMSDEDVHLTRIAPNFTWLDDSVAWPRKNVGISEQRWDEYRLLFQRTHASTGVIKRSDPTRIMFPIVSGGLVPTGFSKGLVFSRTPLSPVLKSLDEKPPDQLWQGSRVLVYKPIDKDWYLYYEQW